MNKIGFAVTGSFCSMDDMLDVLKQLCQNYEVEVFVTPHVYKMDTRFYSHSELISHIQNITGKKVNSKYEGWIHALGFFLFIAFMIYISYSDILRLLGKT